MSSTDSSDEEIMVMYHYLRNKEKKMKRRYWVHPYLEKNIHCRLFVATKELQQTDSKFIAFYRMSKDSYMNLVQLITPYIRQKNTNMRECVSAEERLLITLRYLATGGTFVSISIYFARGETTVGCIVAETSAILWAILNKKYMPIPDKQQWKIIAERFETLWNLPNCIGALDGKHVRIEKFPNTGSTNYNYKSFHSVILMACCDADGLFTMIEVGYAGRNSDGGIFRASAMKHWITHAGFDIPPPSPLKYDEKKCRFPYYLAADEAFPLSSYLMRPYAKKTLDNMKRIFNYRLSRARKTIECTFGMAAEKWAILNGPIRGHDPKKVNDFIKAACILHNYVRKTEGLEYTPIHIDDHEIVANENYVIPPTAPTVQNTISININSSANVLRNYLANYFINPRAALPWQWKYCC